MSKEKNQRDLLSQWLNQAKKSEEGLPNEKITEGRLSHGQERLFFLQKLHGSNPFYHYTEVYSFYGKLDVEAMVSAFQSVVKKHDILRTQILLENDRPIQRILPDLEAEISIEDVPGISPSELQTKQREAATRPLPFDEGSLVRLSVFRVADDRVDFVVTMHHIITDKWSMEVVREDWAHFYKVAKGETSILPASGKRYIDHAQEQKNSKPSEETIEYWKNKLEGIPQELPIDHDHKRPSLLTYSGGFVEKPLSEDLSTRLLSLARQEKVTPYVLFLSLFKLLLSRYTHSQDIVVGSPISNRKEEALEKSIGFFNETLVLRSQVDGGKSFKQLLQAVQETVIGAFSHSELAFEHLVKLLEPERRENINPIFQVMFLYHDVPENPEFHPDLTLEYAPFDLGVAKFDLTLYISNDQGKLSAIIEYSKDVFLEDRITHILEDLVALAEKILGTPDLGIDQLEHLSEASGQKIAQWERGHMQNWPFSTVIEKFDHIASAHPTNEATWHQGSALTYGDLDIQSKSLASALIQSGVQNGEGVGLMVQNGHDLLKGIMGILRAGAFYIPLDPEYPSERLSFMLNDAQVKTVVTDQTSKYPQLEAASIIEISTAINVEEVDLPVISGNDAAYMIYTSGSTGTPKGVKVYHDSLANSTFARAHYYGDEACRYLLMSSFAFDSSVAGIFWSITYGGCLITAPKRIEQDVFALGKIIQEARATHTLLLPSLYKVLLEALEKSQLASLEKVIVAGEACPDLLIQMHYNCLPKARLYNEYGPTEATVWSTVSEIVPKTDRVTIGGPIANTLAKVVDKDGRKVSPGVRGELLLGGKNVTRGYHDRPELTEKKFVKDQHKDGLWYRTGDLVKWDLEGELVFLGRTDRQVKVRGYRIELDDIQSSLYKHEAVTEAVADVITQGEKQMLAIFYEGNLDPEVGKDYLSESLPRYMVPEVWVSLPQLPRLPNGKVNMAALSAHLAISSPKKSSIEIASSEKETILSSIWKEVLHLEEVGVTENFFSIGGDSIKSIQILSKARRAGLQLKTEDIFSYQTIRELAHHASWDQDNITETIAEGKAPWLPIHHWFFDLHKAAAQHWGQGYQVTTDRALTKEEIQDVYHSLLKHHDGLRAQFSVSTEEIIIPPYTAHPIDELGDGQSLTMYLQDWMSAAQLDQGPLFRILLKDEHTAVLSGHHLVLDAVSWQIILEDFQMLLSAPEQDLPNISASIRSWSEKLQGLDTSRAKEWWAKISEGITISDVTKSISEEDLISFPITVPISFDLFTQDRGNALGMKKEEVSLTLALLLLQHLHHEITPIADIEGYGRRHAEIDIDISRSVGWFTNMYALVFPKADHGALPSDYLIKIKERYRQAQPIQIELGLVQHIEQKAQKLPFERVVFNYLGALPSTSGTEFIIDGVRNPDSERDYFLEVNVYENGGQWIFNLILPRSYTQHTSGDIQKYLEAQAKIITQILEGGEQKWTPSDFEDVDLSQDDLDLLMDQFE